MREMFNSMNIFRAHTCTYMDVAHAWSICKHMIRLFSPRQARTGPAVLNQNRTGTDLIRTTPEQIGPDQNGSELDRAGAELDQNWTGPGQHHTEPDWTKAGLDQGWIGPELNQIRPELERTGPD